METLSKRSGYLPPEIEVLEVSSREMLCQSGNSSDYYLVDPWA